MYCTRYHLFSTISLSALFLSSAAYGLPQGGTVAAGDATIASSGASAIVTQGSGRAVIDWRSFDVGAGEKVEFKQPSASSVTLNRIHDQKPSEILGSITANGQVILSNPSGMLFGKDSRIDVAGLVATSASAGTDAFMQGGRLALDQAGRPDAKIVSRGTITAKEAGLVALVAPRVENTGTITARLGLVQLAGADTAAVDLYGDGLVAVAVTGKAASTSVTQSGRITAGRIAFTAADAAHLIESVVNTTGVLEASDARVDKGGTVVFGGTIELTGRDVTVGEGAELHADGRDGGGIIKLGGGWQGRGTIPNARNTAIAKGAIVTANAKEKGQGGTIAVWADQATQFDGTILAKGGPKGGDGGSVETSGKEQLGVTGTVDASAPKGKAGDWLLDPRNVTISGAGAYSVNPMGETVDPGSDGFTILASSISTALSNGNNVTITTGTTGAQVGDITLSNATISKTGGGDATLTLKAEASITTTGTNSISSTSGKLHTILWSDANNDQSGYISLTNTAITSNGGDVILGGGVDNGADILAATDGATLLYDGIAGDGRPDGYAWGNGASTSGVRLTNGDITSGTGNIIIRGHGMDSAGTASLYGIYVRSGSLLDANGLMLMDGVGGLSSGAAFGVVLTGSGTILKSSTGGIAFNGTGGNSVGDSDYGILLQSSAAVTSDGTGGTAAPVAIYGKGGGGAGGINYGVAVVNGGTVFSKAGDITIAAVGGTGGNFNYGFRLNNASITADGYANITISGTGGAGTSPGDFYIGTPTSLIGGPAATGMITFRADKISSFTDVTVQTQGSIRFLPRTPGTSIGISGGSCGGSCTLQITDAALGMLNPDSDGNGIGSLIIGDAAAGTGLVDINGWDLSGKSYDAEVYGGTVDLTGGPVTWSGDNDILLHSRTGHFVIDQNFTRSAGTAGDGTLTIKAAGNITTSGTRTISAASGATSGKLHTILWSDAEAAPNNNGYIILGSVSIATNNGDLVLAGGLDDGAIGGMAGDGRPDNFSWGNAMFNDGVTLTGSTVDSGSGSIRLIGHGRNDAASNLQYGIGIYNNATVRSSTGDIHLTGTGGNGTDSNYGIVLNHASTLLTTVDGNIRFDGRGGAATANSNYGILLVGGSSVTSTGPAANGATITMTGHGGTGTNNNGGIDLSASSIISSANHDIVLDGTGGAGTTSNIGIFLNNAAAVRSTGTGSNAADITMTGTAGGGSLDNAGIFLINGGTSISAIDGDISLTGTGGNGSSSGRGHGILIQDGSSVVTTGIGSGAGKIALEGHGADMLGSNFGIYLVGAVLTTSVETIDGSITFDGFGGMGTSSNIGIAISGAQTSIATANGAVNLNGHGGNGTGVFNRGIEFASGSRLMSTGQGTAANGVALTGAGGTGTGEASGILINGGAMIQTADASVSLSGTGGNTGVGASPGVYLYNAGSITSTGAASISLQGTGRNIADVYSLTGANRIGGSSATGNIEIIGDSIGVSSDFTAQTTGAVTLKPRTPNTPINVAGGAGPFVVTTGTLNNLNVSNITIGDSTSGLITVNPYGSWASRAASGVNFVSGPGGITFTLGAHDFGSRSLTATTSGPLSVNGAITAGDALLRTTGATSDITIGAAGSIAASGAGDALILASGRNFINNRGAAALSTPAARWLVYSGSPGTNATGGLIADFSRYACEYGTCSGFTPGLNGFLYREVVSGGSSGGSGGHVPTPPVTPPVGAPGNDRPPTPSAPVITTGLPDFIRKQDIVTRIQVNATPRGDAFSASGATPFLPGDRDLKDDLAPAATQEEADSRIRADDRRRRWFDGELYTVSPDLARDLEGQ